MGMVKWVRFVQSLKQFHMKRTLFLFLALPYLALAQGRVGINTNTPQATLHVAGTMRIDSVQLAVHTERILVLDSQNIVHTISADSFAKSSPIVSYYAEAETIASTSSSVLQTRVSLVVPPGRYLLSAYCEAYNTSIASGVRAQVNEGVTEIAYGALYSDQNTFSPWSMMRCVTVAVPTTYTLLWGSWPAGNTSFIRRARLVALKL